MNKTLFIILLAISAVFYFGCDQKEEEPKDGVTDTTSVLIPEDSVEQEDTVVVKEVIPAIPDLTGKWTGTFDGRSTVMNITQQDGKNFSGKISINYRQAINQDIKGSIDPENQKIQMKDQLHSRFQGKYYGTLSKDGTNYSGTFTMDLDGSKFSFNLNKQ